KILKSGKVTLGHISIYWAWLRKIINELPDDDDFLDFKDLMFDEIDNRWEKVYNPIFSILLIISRKDNDTFIDEWLMYQNYKKIFKKDSLFNHPSIAKSPLRYWRTVLIYAPNLAEFAYRLFSIPPNSAISKKSKVDKISLTSTTNIQDKDDKLGNCNYEVDKIISNLEQVFSNIIDDIEDLDPDNRNNLPTISLFKFFNPQLIHN
ncbi:14186_t:CDS:2, partial [Dentiscutata heterogama]